MPPKNGESSSSSKMVSIDTVAILLMALGATTISQKQLEMMSAIDGTRTAKSFSHQMHEITKKAKELKARVDAGEEFVPVQAKKRGATQMSSASVTPPKKKAKGAASAPKAKGRGKVKTEPEGSASPFDNQDNFYDAHDARNGYDDEAEGHSDVA
ncbi:uncharacterized protein BDZ99DRAFT_57893 [Mytilinidion resinicola]|uniref:Uncharacterized protein n=1 Tax=Mytilinidion resinicola TaxID=574789 RepID=A0A6A6YI79_9PEZI|nr:uncharacterized protein BDZ99DRAFT_57893 [Mytilinidion resinicola]KAF2808552.1 hypothetical protein BDZ99DRAFT_57893 [Mytilinidion resinicola]